MKEFLEDIDKPATINMNGLFIDVIITDVKISYGNKRWKVKPVAGKGEIWIERVNLKKQ